MRDTNTTSRTIATIMIVMLVLALLLGIANAVWVYRLYREFKAGLPAFDMEPESTKFLLAILPMIASGIVCFVGLSLFGLGSGILRLYRALTCYWIAEVGIPALRQLVMLYASHQPIYPRRFASLLLLVPMSLYFYRSATIARLFGSPTRPGIRADAVYWWLRARGRSPKTPSVFPEFE